MGRTLVAAVIGALAVFAWGFVSWTVLDLYGFALKSLPNSDAVVSDLKNNIPTTGAYFFPARPDMANEEAIAAWSAAHRTGPVGMILFRAEGREPMPPTLMVRGFSITLVGALAVALLMRAMNIRSFIRRVFFAILLSVFALAATHVQQWNWFHFPDEYTTALVIDVMAGWTLGGAVIAALLRPKKVEAIEK